MLFLFYRLNVLGGEFLSDPREWGMGFAIQLSRPIKIAVNVMKTRILKFNVHVLFKINSSRSNAIYFKNIYITVHVQYLMFIVVT